MGAFNQVVGPRLCSSHNHFMCTVEEELAISLSLFLIWLTCGDKQTDRKPKLWYSLSLFRSVSESPFCVWKVREADLCFFFYLPSGHSGCATLSTLHAPHPTMRQHRVNTDPSFRWPIVPFRCYSQGLGSPPSLEWRSPRQILNQRYSRGLFTLKRQLLLLAFLLFFAYTSLSKTSGLPSHEHLERWRTNGEYRSIILLFYFPHRHISHMRV